MITVIPMPIVHFILTAEHEIIRYKRMSNAIDNTNWNVHFSMCLWGKGEVWLWGAGIGDSWVYFNIDF
jgi:hypothetical protein